MEQKPDVLPYARPPEPEPKRPLDRYCWLSLALSLVSCAFPLIAAVAVGLAVYGLIRRRKTQERGIAHATTAIGLSMLGLAVFIGATVGASRAKAASQNIACMSNLRQVGLCILMYENEHRDARGYELADVVTFSSPSLSRTVQCPSSPILDASKTAGTTPSSYVLLTALEPFMRLPNASTTITAFELTPHHVPAYDGFPESDHINALFADGHVESIPLDKAASAIEKSLLARPSATSRPVTRSTTAPSL